MTMRDIGDEAIAPARNNSAAIWLALVLGVAVAVVFHFYLVARWETYVASLTPERVASLGGRPPSPSIASTGRSALHGALLLFLVAVGIAWTIKSGWIPAVIFGVASGLTSFVFWSLRPGGVGNLWPISLLLVLLLSVVPAIAGFACGRALLRWFRVRS